MTATVKLSKRYFQIMYNIELFKIVIERVKHYISAFHYLLDQHLFEAGIFVREGVTGQFVFFKENLHEVSRYFSKNFASIPATKCSKINFCTVPDLK